MDEKTKVMQSVLEAVKYAAKQEGLILKSVKEIEKTLQKMEKTVAK